jgi:DNA-binding NtrC family response regulator
MSALSVAGYEAVKADSVTEALDLLKFDYRFDVILSDLRMPKMNGLQFLEELKARHPMIPVIIISACKKADREDEILQKGAFAYLEKPFHIPDLIRLIEDATSLAHQIKYPFPELRGLEELVFAR